MIGFGTGLNSEAGGLSGYHPDNLATYPAMGGRSDRSESRDSLPVGTAILIGYLRYPEEWPDPVRFIDPTWASSERRLVADERCTRVNQFRRLSVCGFVHGATGQPR
jgi:hypothetical protein